MASVHPDQLEAWNADDTGRLYRLIVDSIPQLVWASAPDGDADYFNSRLLDYTGTSADQLAGQRWREIIHPDDREHVFVAWNAAACTGERYTSECRLRRADGAYRWHHVSALPLRGANGRVLHWFGTCTDIEDQVRSARLLESTVDERTRALRKAEQRFEAFLDHLPANAWIRDSQFRYTYVNRLYAKACGVEPGTLLGRGAAEFFPPAVVQRFRETDREVQREGAPMQYVDDLPSGRWLKVKFPVPDRAGGVGVGGIAVDITERSRLEEALRESEKRFRAFMDHAPAVAWIKDARFRYSYVNRPFERYHHRPAKDLLGRDDFELFPAEVARYFRTDDEDVLKGGEAVQKLRQFPYADGRLAHWLVVKFPFADASGATGLAGIAIDVTPRVAAEEKARRYAEDVRNLVNRLVQAQEAERRRVADELHDLIGQNLTALGIDLQALKQRLQSGGDLIAGPRLDAMAALVETTIDAIRGVMTDLRPAALEEFGLVPALRWYASLFSKRTGMKVSTNVSGRELRLPRDTELALFRIVQEALTNAAKHSGGTSVEIAIRYGAGLRLTVEDDGRGFAEPVGARSARRGGFGLPTMRERAEAHGGTLRVEFPARGTRLVVDMPAPGHGD